MQAIQFIISCSIYQQNNFHININININKFVQGMPIQADESHSETAARAAVFISIRTAQIATI